MNRERMKLQRGQALVLVALAMIALLAMLALVLDGGTTFAIRREMQNAADAGALAGVRELCYTKNEGQAIFYAEQYAEEHNSAEQAFVSADLDTRKVVVTATRQVSTFFAHFIGRDNIPVQAVAEAFCSCPQGGSVLPVAWACKPPINEDLSSSDDCQQQRLTETELNYYLSWTAADIANSPPAEMYIIMDSPSVPNDLLDVCEKYLEDGTTPNPYYINCDLDDDGDDDLIAGGGRSWLDLDGGGGGSSELAGWIEDGFNGSIWQHDWLGDQPGVANDVFQTAAEFEGKTVLVPVYDKICDSNQDPQTACPGEWDTGLDTTIDNSGGNYYYHIVGFAAFYMTCVDAPGVRHAEGTKLYNNACPGHYYVKANNDALNGASFKSIEGYFVEFFPAELKGSPVATGCIDLGVYIPYLTR